MKTLLYKQLRLVCHPMTPVFCLFGFMVIIPNYPYTVIFFYVMLGLFFSFLDMREKKDLYYTALLPVPKRDAVKAGCLFTALIEIASLVIAVPFAVWRAHTSIGGNLVGVQPGKDNLVGLDPNLALFAAGFLLYAVFNAVFLPSFYANGYKVGVAFVKAIIPTMLAMIVFEALPHVPGLMWLDDMDAATQVRLLPYFVAAVLLYGIGTVLTFRRAAAQYEKVDL